MKYFIAVNKIIWINMHEMADYKSKEQNLKCNLKTNLICKSS